MQDVIVVGAGIVGLATAHEILTERPGTRLTVLDAESRVAAHQSSHNSGVLHAGVYYAPGSLKARLCREGKQRLEAFAREHDVPVATTGKVIVATERDELPRLRELASRAERNGVPGLEWLDRDGLRQIEPHVEGVAALHSPTTGVTDFAMVAQALAEQVRRAGGHLRLGTAVVDLEARDDHARVATTQDDLEARTVVTCGGLQSDRLAALTGDDEGARIVPFRGSWRLLAPRLADAIRGNVYPVPDPRYPFLGVHFTRRLDGAIWVGPNAVLAGGRHAYRRGTLSFRDLTDVARHPGFWRLIPGNAAFGLREFLHDRVGRLYLREVQRYLPEVQAADLLPGPSGVRAQLVNRDGALVDDFALSGSGRVLHVRNAPSPAATASLAIGAVLRDEVLARL